VLSSPFLRAGVTVFLDRQGLTEPALLGKAPPPSHPRSFLLSLHLIFENQHLHPSTFRPLPEVFLPSKLHADNITTLVACLSLNFFRSPDCLIFSPSAIGDSLGKLVPRIFAQQRNCPYFERAPYSFFLHLSNIFWAPWNVRVIFSFSHIWSSYEIREIVPPPPSRATLFPLIGKDLF